MTDPIYPEKKPDPLIEMGPLKPMTREEAIRHCEDLDQKEGWIEVQIVTRIRGRFLWMRMAYSEQMIAASESHPFIATFVAEDVLLTIRAAIKKEFPNEPN